MVMLLLCAVDAPGLQIPTFLRLVGLDRRAVHRNYRGACMLVMFGVFGRDAGMTGRVVMYAWPRYTPGRRKSLAVVLAPLLATRHHRQTSLSSTVVLMPDAWKAARELPREDEGHNVASPFSQRGT